MVGDKDTNKEAGSSWCERSPWQEWKRRSKKERYFRGRFKMGSKIKGDFK